MGTLELKKVINQYTSQITDAEILLKVKSLYEFHLKKDTSFYDQLPVEVQELLEKSREQVKEGSVIPHKEVMAKYRKIYNIPE